jgi:hypothetical protein
MQVAAQMLEEAATRAKPEASIEDASLIGKDPHLSNGAAGTLVKTKRQSNGRAKTARKRTKIG